MPLLQLSSWDLAALLAALGGSLPRAVEASGAEVAAGVGRARPTWTEALIGCPHMPQNKVLIATFQQELVTQDRFTKG